MYRVTYYFNNSNAVASKEFQSLKEATDFSIKQPINSIIEIKENFSVVTGKGGG